MDKPSDLVFTTLESKLKDLDGVDYDFLSTFISIKKEEIRLIDIVIFDNNLCNRLDKLTSYYYGDNKYLDLFLDYNDIINPFDIKYGQLIFVPDLDALLSNYQVIKNTGKLRHLNKTIEKSLSGIMKRAINNSTTKIGNGNYSNRLKVLPKVNNKAIIF